MFLRILVVIGITLLCNVKEVTSENDESNISLVNIEQHAVEEHTISAQPETDPVIERSSHFHPHVEPRFHGFWKKKFTWRPRWVKTWQEKKVYVAVWKRMWGPAVLNEWVPVAKPPPGWVKHGHTHSHGAVYVTAHHH